MVEPDSDSTRPQGAGVGRSVTALAALFLVAAVVAAVGSGALIVHHASKEVYAIPLWGVVLTLGVLALSLVGFGLVGWSREARVSARVLGATALACFAFFSLGLLGLLVAAGLVVWSTRTKSAGPRAVPAAYGAVLAGVSLGLLMILAMGGPVVDCDSDGGISEEENVFMGLLSWGGGTSTSSGGGGPVDPAGNGSGHAEGDGYAYSYECSDGRLARFDLRWR